MIHLDDKGIVTKEIFQPEQDENDPNSEASDAFEYFSLTLEQNRPPNGLSIRVVLVTRESAEKMNLKKAGSESTTSE